MPKAILAAQKEDFMKCLTFAFPNLDELIAMAGDEYSKKDTNEESAIQDAAMIVLEKMNETESHLVISMGKEGVLLASKEASKPIKFQHFPTNEIVVSNCTGAGDTLAGSFIHSLQKGCSIEESIACGMKDALLSLECSDRTISPKIS